MPKGSISPDRRGLSQPLSVYLTGIFQNHTFNPNPESAVNPSTETLQQVEPGAPVVAAYDTDKVYFCHYGAYFAYYQFTDAKGQWWGMGGVAAPYCTSFDYHPDFRFRGGYQGLFKSIDLVDTVLGPGDVVVFGGTVFNPWGTVHRREALQAHLESGGDIDELLGRSLEDSATS